MVNQTLEAGRLVSRAISEVKSSQRGMSMTQVLIDSGVIGSDSALSWIRKGKVKDIRRYLLVINEVTKFLPPSRRDYYRLRMFDIVVVIYSGSVPVISNLWTRCQEQHKALRTPEWTSSSSPSNLS